MPLLSNDGRSLWHNPQMVTDLYDRGPHDRAGDASEPPTAVVRPWA